MDNIISQLLNKEHLSESEEYELTRRWNDNQDEKALGLLIASHLKLAVACAFRHKHYGISVHDLIQEGIVGLISAAKRFDPPNSNIRFSGYCKWWIKASIQDYIMRNWSIVRMGNTKANRQLFFHLNRIKNQVLNIKNESMDNDDVKKISDLLQLKTSDIKNVEARLLGGDLSLNASIKNDATESFQDFIIDEALSAEEVTHKQNFLKQQILWIEDALKSLTPQEQYIIKNRYLSHEEQTLSDMGDKLGLSRERIRQIEVRSFRKMRHQLVYKSGVRKSDIMI